MRGGAALVAGALLLPAPASWAQAPPATPALEKPGVEVSARRCTWLAADELERLTHLELDGPSKTIDSRLLVDFSCAGDDVTIGVASPRSGIRVERLVTGACCEDVDPERTLALLAAGLLQAAKPLLGPPRERVAGAETTAEVTGGGTVVLPAIDAKSGEPAAEAPALAPMPEVLAQPTPLAPPPQPAPGALAPWAPAVVPGFAPNQITGATPWPTPDQPREEAPTPVHEIGVGPRLRLLNLAAPITTYGVGASYQGFPWRRIGFGPFIEAAFGSQTRRGGEVDVQLVQLGAVATWKMVVAGPFGLRLDARPALALAHLAGDAIAVDTPTSDVFGLTGSLALGLVPSLQSGRTIIAIPLEFGGLLRAPRGIVQDDDAVQLDGLTFAAGLSVAYGLGSHPSGSR
ncbi:MAG: hypothetical protein R3B72_46470 [Polyangiaceae bacterium]